MAYATTKAPKNPIIVPTILFFLSLKIAYKITNEILIGINNKNSGNAIAYPNPSSNLFISLINFIRLKPALLTYEYIHVVLHHDANQGYVSSVGVEVLFSLDTGTHSTGFEFSALL